MAAENFADQEPPFLQQVYSPHPETPDIDLVFVHGLNLFGHKDHAFRTWTYVNSASKILWPQKLLPMDFPRARILIFGYNSNISKGVSQANISDHANSLLGKLEGMRLKKIKIPIIFLGHSLGGLVIKQALLNAKGSNHYDPVYEATFGLVFFSTPHRGGNTGVGATLVAGIAKLFANDGADNNLLMCLKPDSLFTQDSSERFSEQVGRYSILTFFETIPMKFHGINKIVVSRHSAVLSAPQERKIDLNRNHSEICKFADRGNAYETFRVNLDHLVTEALGLAGKANLSHDAKHISSSTSVNETQETVNTASISKKDEGLSTTARTSGQSHDRSQDEDRGSSSTNISSQFKPQMASEQNVKKKSYTSSLKYYTPQESISDLNDRFLKAAKVVDTPLIYNWVQDPIRRPRLYSQHLQTALLSLAGFEEGANSRFRNDAVSVILDECNPNLECRDETNKATPLMLAAYGRRDTIVLLLVNKGASLKAKDDIYGRTALAWAARSNACVSAEIILKALEKDQDREIINTVDNKGLTALKIASRWKYERMERLLKLHGAI